MDSGTTFKSAPVKAVHHRLNVKTNYRAAYKPSGNSIVKKHLRTVKAGRGQL